MIERGVRVSKRRGKQSVHDVKWSTFAYLNMRLSCSYVDDLSWAIAHKVLGWWINDLTAFRRENEKKIKFFVFSLCSCWDQRCRVAQKKKRARERVTFCLRASTVHLANSAVGSSVLMYIPRHFHTFGRREGAGCYKGINNIAINVWRVPRESKNGRQRTV